MAVAAGNKTNFASVARFHDKESRDEVCVDLLEGHKRILDLTDWLGWNPTNQHWSGAGPAIIQLHSHYQIQLYALWFWIFV